MIKKFKFRVFIMGTIMSDTKYTSVDSSLEFYDDKILFCDSYGDRYEVEPENVAQFVGYDKNGKEIYSDDKILSPNGLISDVSAMLLNPDDLQNFELVEMTGISKQ